MLLKTFELIHCFHFYYFNFLIFLFMFSSEGNQASGQKSGAYIFRPNSTACYPVQMAADNGGASIELVVRGAVVSHGIFIFLPILLFYVKSI